MNATLLLIRAPDRSTDVERDGRADEKESGVHGVDPFQNEYWADRPSICSDPWSVCTLNRLTS